MKNTITRKWHVVDAKTKTLGRLSTEIAKYLIGKHQANYTPNVDSGDFVVVINAKELILTGAKLQNKKYQTHSGIPGGFKEKTAQEMLDKSPRKVIEHAVKGMLPKNKLQDIRMGRLKVYDAAEHPHTAQLAN